MFCRLSVLVHFLFNGIFTLQWGVLLCNTILSQGASVQIFFPLALIFPKRMELKFEYSN